MKAIPVAPTAAFFPWLAVQAVMTITDIVRPTLDIIKVFRRPSFSIYRSPLSAKTNMMRGCSAFNNNCVCMLVMPASFAMSGK